MKIETIQEYIQLARFLGGYTELVQGSGGNISVKEGDLLCVKSSGKRLCATTEKEGYTLCSMEALRAAGAQGGAAAELDSARCGGCPGERPSMEVWFHLLPAKWIVHLHPTFLLGALCSKGWRRLQTRYSHKHIAYTTPGKELADAIFQVYEGQQVLFLQNHGIIIAAESAEATLEILDTLWREVTASGIRTPLYLSSFRGSIVLTGAFCLLLASFAGLPSTANLPPSSALGIVVVPSGQSRWP
jgi:rhamnose utilization protein RhaD (predicted bifunctional aldolase and dehydrogenase)